MILSISRFKYSENYSGFVLQERADMIKIGDNGGIYSQSFPFNGYFVIIRKKVGTNYENNSRCR